MLRKYSNNRTLSDNIKLGSLTALVAGMVNVTSLLLFFSFSSNVTGYYAILIAELMKGNLYQFAIVLIWVAAFFFGSFLSNIIVIHYNKNKYLAHALPILLEMASLLFVGIYGNYFYGGTLIETEFLLLCMLFAMGLQNGLTASISNFAVKTTHLTGATTDLAILFSMFTHKRYRREPEIRKRMKLLLSIFSAYITGAFLATFLYDYTKFGVFYIVCVFLTVILVYDLYKIKGVYSLKKKRKQRPVNAPELAGEFAPASYSAVSEYREGVLPIPQRVREKAQYKEE